GEDRQWRWARARLLGEGRVELSHPDIAEPVAVRYAWGDNPVANLYAEGRSPAGRLPVTPFRTDAWPPTD
ncbi:MAG: sialate O-acetylesterase, partial [Planctomycetota bacterium]